MSAASVAETIIVQPAEERLYSSQFRLETDNNLLNTAVPEDDGDSGIGFTIGKYNMRVYIITFQIIYFQETLMPTFLRVIL